MRDEKNVDKPKRLEVHEHCWNDGWNPHTVIRAIFFTFPEIVPVGWVKATQYEYLGIAFLKKFPYGTSVINGHIVA